MMIETINGFSEIWGSLIWRSCWQGGLVLALVWIVCRSRKRIPPAVQCWLWRLAYAKLLLGLCWAGAIELPLLSPEAPVSISSNDVNDVPVRPDIDGPAATSIDVSASSIAAVTNQPSAQSSPLTSAAPGLTFWLLMAWMTGVAAALARLALQWRSIRKRTAALQPIEDGQLTTRLDAFRRRMRLRQRVHLLRFEGAGTPFLIGIIRPTVVFPQDVLTQASQRELDAALAHELAHVKRRDLLWNWLAAIVETLFFFHPLVWLARREWKLSQESAADALAVSSGEIDVSQYAQSLLQLIARHPVQTPAGQFALGVSDAFTSISRRLSAMKTIAPLSFSRKILASVVLGSTVLAVLPWQLTARDGEKSTKQNDKPETVAEETKPEQPKRTIRVQAVDPQGRPLAGTQIHASVWTDEEFKANRDYKTDNNGWATVMLPDTLDILRLWSSKEDYVPLFAQWWAEKQPDGHLIPAEFTFEMPLGTRIGGVVVDDQGNPVKGVCVQVSADFGPHNIVHELAERPVISMWLAYEEDAALTDENGYWEITNMPEGDDQNVRLTFEHPDFIRRGAWTRNIKAGDGNPSMADLREHIARTELDRGTRISGTVTDPKGNPVPKAVVVWGVDPYLTDGSQEVRTDDKGRYRLPPMASGTVPLTVVAEGWSPFMKDVEIPTDKDELPVNIQLEPGKTIHFQFVNTAGEPVPDVYVQIDRWRDRQSLYNHKHPNVLETAVPRKSDEHGLYEWTWAPEDTVSYNFGKEHYLYQMNKPFTPREKPYEVLLLKERAFSGKVSDAETGQPIPRFRIRPAYANGVFAFPRAVPDRAAEWFTNGKYRFILQDGFPVGYVDVMAEGYQTVRSQAHALPEGDVTFDAKLKKIKADE